MGNNKNLNGDFGQLWDVTIREGNQLEAAALQYLNNQANDCTFIKASDGFFKPYDLICSHCLTTVECKYDSIMPTTGNFCFELPLLQSSHAEYLYFGLNTGHDKIPLYIFVLPQLKGWLKVNRANPKLITWRRGGYQKRNIMALVKRQNLINEPFVKYVEINTV